MHIRLEYTRNIEFFWWLKHEQIHKDTDCSSFQIVRRSFWSPSVAPILYCQTCLKDYLGLLIKERQLHSIRSIKKGIYTSFIPFGAPMYLGFGTTSPLHIIDTCFGKGNDRVLAKAPQTVICILAVYPLSKEMYMHYFFWTRGVIVTNLFGVHGIGCKIRWAASLNACGCKLRSTLCIDRCTVWAKRGEKCSEWHHLAMSPSRRKIMVAPFWRRIIRDWFFFWEVWIKSREKILTVGEEFKIM